MGKSEMDYTNEVPHPQAKGMIVRAAQPFNAEPPVASLVQFNCTPEELVYCRNHSPVFELDEDVYVIRIDGLVNKNLELKLSELREEFKYFEVVAALQCAGNRRNEMGEIKPVKGVTWDKGVIANCKWGGIRLRDVLLRAGVDEKLENAHVWFASHVSVCQDDSYYGSSIPLGKAMDPEGDVLLAFDMNSQLLSPDHGYPIRLVVPGYTGARWVKWLDRITIAQGESPNFYQQRDYRILPPSCANTEQAATLWDKYPSITALPVHSIIAYIDPVITDTSKRLRLKGYAMGNGGKNLQIASVQVAIEKQDRKQENWVNARIIYQEGKWSWTIWECEMDVDEEMRMATKQELRLLCRAKDESGNEQERECAWNMRGVAFCSYGKVVWRW